MTDQSVARWRPIIHEVRELLGIRPDTYPDDVVLALIDVESDGDPEAEKFDGSQFHGLLQMGRYAGIDTGFEDDGADTTEALHGDGFAALQEFLEYQERYSVRHHHDPVRVALLWKAGPGTLARVNRLLVEEGLSFNDAIENAAAELGVPNALEYVERFRRERKKWARWLETQDEPAKICQPLE